MRRGRKSGYTAEEIDYEDAGVLTLGNDQLRGLVAHALSKVPTTVADRVLKGCIFIMPMYKWEKGYFIPKELLRNKCVIALPETLLDDDRTETERIILHEVAHFYHGHKPSLFVEGATEELDRENEEEADRTVNRWLASIAQPGVVGEGDG